LISFKAESRTQFFFYIAQFDWFLMFWKDNNFRGSVVFVLSEWLLDCCLTPNEQFGQLYHGKNKLYSMVW
jgi:hypothetical protein